MPADTLPLLARQTPRRPERILQFGTGRFLRAFADYFVHRAGSGAGSIVAVQSMGLERANALNRQQGCYTLWTRDTGGESHEVVSAISRALSATRDWDAVLDVARSDELKVVLSNTTEVGLVLDPDEDVRAHPPRSFPGKLTAVLYERARHFAYDRNRGLAVLPCELVNDNGDLLRSLVEETAACAGMGPTFLSWLQESSVFCNTLVDRIVPGAPPPDQYRALEQRLGYRDALLITAEDYRLWAIEGTAALKKRLGFANANPDIIVTDDIAPYRLRKVRILNGGHTLTVPLGLLAGHHTVLDNVSDAHTGPFIRTLLREEIGPMLEVDPTTVGPYIDEVLQRWRNPHLVHQLIDITLESTTKMRHRVVPSIRAYYAQRGTVPPHIALGFAAYLCFMRGRTEVDGITFGAWNNRQYPIRDVEAPYLRSVWESSGSIRELVAAVSGDERLWGMDLAALPGWTRAVAQWLTILLEEGATSALGHIRRRPS